MKDNKNNYWYKEIFPKLVNVYNKNKHFLVSKELEEKLKEAQKNIIDRKNEYKNLVQNSKENRVNKKNLELLRIKLEQAKVNKLLIHQEIIDNLNIMNFFHKFYDVFPYKHMGPITSKLIEEIDELSDSYFLDSNFSNPYKTSWGIFKNRIIIHRSKQLLKKNIYTGFYQIESFSHSSCLMLKNHKNLEFYYIGSSNEKESEKFNSVNELNKMENEYFEKNYNWNRNNEVDFRMIFTPAVQESFLQEVNFQEYINPEYKWRKQGYFFFNDFNNDYFNFSMDKQFSETLYYFSRDLNITIEELKEMIFLNILNYYKTIYKSLNYMWLIPIFELEDHSLIIKRILDEKSRINASSIVSFSHYIINEFFDFKISKDKSLDVFHELNEIEDIILHENKRIYKIKMKGTSIKKINRDQLVENYCSIYLCDLQTPYYFINMENAGVYTNINDEHIVNFLKEINKNVHFRIEFGILAILSGTSIQKIDEIAKSIVTKLNSI